VSARIWLRATAGAGVVALASLARADAPSDQYYFFNSSAGTITDNFTGLVWQRYASTAPVPWASSFAVCASMSTSKVTWRVPSYKELLTLVDEVPHTEYENGALVSKAIDPNAFPGTAVDASYWSSSMPASQAGNANAFAVDFHTGVPQLQDSLQNLYVRCVHD
jgi:hypothetical protein